MFAFLKALGTAASRMCRHPSLTHAPGRSRRPIARSTPTK